jgi:hypothetical protein
MYRQISPAAPLASVRRLAAIRFQKKVPMPDFDHASRLRAMAGQATTEGMRERLREMARRSDAGEEDVEGLMVSLFGPEKRS